MTARIDCSYNPFWFDCVTMPCHGCPEYCSACRKYNDDCDCEPCEEEPES